MNWRDNLSNLPEFWKSCQVLETLDTGETVMHKKIPKFVKCDPIKGDDPMFFTDKDGSWTVVYGHEGGPHKRRM